MAVAETDGERPVVDRERRATTPEPIHYIVIGILALAVVALGATVVVLLTRDVEVQTTSQSTPSTSARDTTTSTNTSASTATTVTPSTTGSSTTTPREPVGAFNNPVPVERTLELSDGADDRLTFSVGPLEDGDDVMNAYAANCRGSGCPQANIEDGQHWVFLPITFSNDGPLPRDIGDFIFSLYGSEGIERPARGLCGERGDRQFAEVLPGGEFEYMRCFAVSERDLVGDDIRASFSGALAGVGGDYWFEVDSDDVNFE